MSKKAHPGHWLGNDRVAPEKASVPKVTPSESWWTLPFKTRAEFYEKAADQFERMSTTPIGKGHQLTYGPRVSREWTVAHVEREFAS